LALPLTSSVVVLCHEHNPGPAENGLIIGAYSYAGNKPW
jgi:hypothetical protein